MSAIIAKRPEHIRKLLDVERTRVIKFNAGHLAYIVEYLVLNNIQDEVTVTLQYSIETDEVLASFDTRTLA